MYRSITALILLATILAACAPAPAAAPAASDSPWKLDHITSTPPIMMRDPLIEMLDQSDDPIPYYYEEVVKYSGHSCMVVAAAWALTREALDYLYPGPEVPVRGQIQITAPGAEDEWNIGVFGEVMSYVTGAAPKTGFSGSIFKGNPLMVRQNLFIYTEEPVGLKPPNMEWIFTRLDTGASVAVAWNITKVVPPINEANLTEPGAKLASGAATPEEAAKFNKDWADAAQFILENAGKVEGLVRVRPVP